MLILELTSYLDLADDLDRMCSALRGEHQSRILPKIRPSVECAANVDLVLQVCHVLVCSLLQLLLTDEDELECAC